VDRTVLAGTLFATYTVRYDPRPQVLFGLRAGGRCPPSGRDARATRGLQTEAVSTVISVGDHPYFAERLDAYAALGVRSGRNEHIPER